MWRHEAKRRRVERALLHSTEFTIFGRYSQALENKKVLVVAYYWPPSGGSGVQRWLKFVKYLPPCGVAPYVYTPDNPAFDVRDESLQKDVPAEAKVIRFPIFEPYEAFFRLSRSFDGQPAATPTSLLSAGKKSWFQHLIMWIRANLFIPDPRVFWVRPSVRFLKKYLKDQGITTIITTGPPHSMHLIGLKLKQQDPSLRWLADFRDPWSAWGLLDSLGVGARARRRHQQMEAKVLRAADAVITITPFYVRQFQQLSGRAVTLLTNGFDSDDFERFVPERTQHFMIRHVGIVNEKCDPRPFMHAVKALLEARADMQASLRIDFTGEVHPQFRAFVSSDPLLTSITSFSPPVPHKQVIDVYGASSVLLLVLTGYKDAEGYMPGKLFEYIATGLPVLGVGPEAGDASQLLRSSAAGEMIDGHRAEAIQQFLIQHFEAWKHGSTPKSGLPPGAQAYSRRALTQQLAGML